MLKIVLAFAVAASIASAQAKIPVLIVSGANNHDWEWTSRSLERMLEATGRFDADITFVPAAMLGDKDVVAHYRAFVLDYNGPRWGEPAESNFLAAVKGGAGVAVIHAANNSFPEWAEYTKLVGDCWCDGKTSHGSFHPFDLKILDRTHPITRGLGDITAHPDELYHNLVRSAGATPSVLASAFSSKESGGTGKDELMLTVSTYGAGRVFHTPLGHVWPGSPAQRVSHDDPQFQRLIARGVEWAATGDVIERDRGGEWITLFDGTSTAAWRGYGQKGFPEKGWSVVDGALVSAKGGGGGDLVSAAQFGSFELEFEFRTTAKANSGVLYRVVELDGAATWYSGPEYQVLDDSYFDAAPDMLHAAGALYDICPAAEGVHPLQTGQWNKARIVVDGWKVAHYLNGALVAQCDFSSADGRARVQKSKFAPLTKPMQFMTNARGHIALQDHGDEVAYRAIRVRPTDSGTLALFNGVDFSGWTWFTPDGAAREKVWSIAQGGELVCAGSPTGYLRTTADFSNYILELDWRWNPASTGNRNSGVLLCMQGEDKVWPKCLEGQLKEGSAGDFWLMDGFACKTDPARTKDRNVKKLREGGELPPGEWNHYRITVSHGTVTLEVNGQEQNRASEVLEKPGKICLQSEGAEIHFKNVLLTPLP